LFVDAVVGECSCGGTTEAGLARPTPATNRREGVTDKSLHAERKDRFEQPRSERPGKAWMEAGDPPSGGGGNPSWPPEILTRREGPCCGATGILLWRSLQPPRTEFFPLPRGRGRATIRIQILFLVPREGSGRIGPSRQPRGGFC